MNGDDLERNCRSLFEVLSRNLPGRTEESNKESQSG
jgi:hypothetical protein